MFSLLLLFVLSLPSHFVIEKPQVFTKEMSYFLAEEGEAPFAEVKRQQDNCVLLFTCYDSEGKKTCSARAAYFSSISHMRVFSAENESLAIIRYHRSVLLPPSFEVLSPTKRLLAYGDLNWLGTRFTLYNLEGEELLTYLRPYFHIFGKDDFWHVKVYEDNTLHPQIVAMIGILQTDLQMKETVIRPA